MSEEVIERARNDELWNLEVWNLDGDTLPKSIDPDSQREFVILAMEDIVQPEGTLLVNGHLLEFYNISIRPEYGETKSEFFQRILLLLNQVNDNEVRMRLKVQRVDIFECAPEVELTHFGRNSNLISRRNNLYQCRYREHKELMEKAKAQED